MGNTTFLKKCKFIFKFLLTKLYNLVIIKLKVKFENKKKEKIMLNTLKTYLETYTEERNVIALTSDEEAIRELVTKYEEEVRKNFAENKAKRLEEKDNAIKVITELIARETEKEKEREEERIKAEAEAEARAKEEAEAEVIKSAILSETETTSTSDESKVLGDLSLADL